MKYKGYIGHVEYDDEAKIFYGGVVGLSDIITFQGEASMNWKTHSRVQWMIIWLGAKIEGKNQKKHSLAF